MREYGSRGGPSLDRCPRCSIGSRRHECTGETLTRIRVKVKRIEWRVARLSTRKYSRPFKHFAAHSRSPAIGRLREKRALRANQRSRAIEDLALDRKGRRIRPKVVHSRARCD